MLPGFVWRHHLNYVSITTIIMINATLKRQTSPGVDLHYSVIIPAYNEESYLPATLAGLHLAMTASLLGIRDSRRIKGEYTVNLDDYLARREFPAGPRAWPPARLARG